MKFVRLPLCVLLLWLPSAAFSQSDMHKSDAQKAATQADQTAKEIVLIGEIHGTQEMPRLFSNLVTVAAREKNQRIGVGFENPIQLQPLIDEAVKNNMKINSFRQQLIANPIWQQLNYGTSSEAMLDLICDMLRLAQSQKLSLFFFDTHFNNPKNDRDEKMAQFIGQRARAQNYDMTFILTGDVHANKASQDPWGMKIVPMGHWLVEQGFAVHSYDMRYGDGETWDCILPPGATNISASTPECGVHPMKADSDAIDQGYDGLLFLGPVHASPPAHGSIPLK